MALFDKLIQVWEQMFSGKKKIRRRKKGKSSAKRKTGRAKSASSGRKVSAKKKRTMKVGVRGRIFSQSGRKKVVKKARPKAKVVKKKVSKRPTAVTKKTSQRSTAGKQNLNKRRKGSLGKTQSKKKALGTFPLPQKNKSEQEGVLVGEITHYFSRIMVCVLKVTKQSLLINDRIRIKGRATDFVDKVGSMQIESSDVRVARKGQLVGLKVKDVVREGDLVYKI